jgi:hypothetical protein
MHSLRVGRANRQRQIQFGGGECANGAALVHAMKVAEI